MPGSPDPVLGSDALTLAVACALAALVAAAPYGFRGSLPRPAVLAVGGGAVYACLCLAVWALARLVTVGLPAAAVERPATLAVVLLLNGFVIALQVAIPYYAYARWRFVAPLAGAFAATVAVLVLFLNVNGETDPVGLYPFVFGPPLVVAICVLALAEGAVRRVLLAG
ncbi:hypothetical protein M0R88_17150 [Halorussus gelatinilyticus]|uniref:Uncharacterized protein n=1 Tax=Halorussus gelatinilyticus TaxID=2937524 RepID=A0A8U0IHP5_9EURY|nr:hypothetical protein [Halorussus gelatinilyticus]UPW00225.1 hypothetical protein M0R88_17150 [Halorussus gelatinilyticus]